jgi:streptomycin 6-kinase
MSQLVPPTLPVVTTLGKIDGAGTWLRQLPSLIEEVRAEFGLALSSPLHGGSCSWVAPVELPDGTAAILKIGWPHREMYSEPTALRAWDGHGAVRLLAHDPGRHALLLQRCRPGDELAASGASAEDRLRIGCGVLRQLWDAPGATKAAAPAATQAAAPAAAEAPTAAAATQATNAPNAPNATNAANAPNATNATNATTGGLERLDRVTAEWADMVDERMARLRPGYDPGLVAEGARLLRDLPASACREVLLHGDFNPGNVLSSGSDWVAIDPKPMIGDAAYDPWPLLEQIDDPFSHPDPPTVLRTRLKLLAEELALEAERIRWWAVARRVETALRAADHGEVEGGAAVMREARTLADL